MAASNAPTTPLGSSGIDSWSGGGWGFPVNSLEHVPDMVFPASIQTLAKMRTDATIASILEAYNSAIIAADWRISPRGADPTLVKICADSLGIPIAGQKVDDEGPVRRRGVKWHEHCRLALLHLPFGFMPFEPVYEVRPDGYAYLSALPERMPSTVVGIDVNDDGTLKSITQTAPANSKANNFGGVEIPAERLLYYVLNREGANWQGTPLIRRCYTDWILKIEGKRANAIGLKRWSSGIPVAEPLPGTNPTPAQIAQAQAMVSNARGGEFAGAVPVGFKLRIIGIEGTLPDALPTLQYYDSQLSRSCLTSLLDLGNTATGSRALGDNFADILGRSLAAIGQTMAETATTLCERLTDYNFGPEAIVPAVTCGDITMSNSVIAEAIVGLATAGVIRVDAGIESYVRQALHLPAAETPYPPAAGKAPAAPVAAPTVPAQVAAAGWQPWVQAAGGADAHTGPERKLVDWFLRGADGQIRWGTHGDFEECLLIAGKHMPPAEAKGFCFTGDTEFLTRDGVMTFADAAGTHQLVLTNTFARKGPVRRDGHWVQAPIRSYGEQPVLSVTIRRGKQRKTIRATPGHIWFASRDGRSANRLSMVEVTTADLEPGMSLGSLMPKTVANRTTASPFGVAAGAVFGDGNREANIGARIDLWGEKDANLLPYFAGCRQSPIKNGNGVLGVRVAGIPGSWKDMPSLDEGVSYLFGWLAGYIAADGSVTKQGAVSLSSARKDHLQFAATVANRLGIATFPISGYERSGFGRPPTMLYKLSFVGQTVPPELLVIPEHRRRLAEAAPKFTSTRWTVESVEDQGEAEEVFCAEVPDTETFALADYVWVHNCSNRHKEATGEWPGPNAHKGIHAAAGDPTRPSQPYRQTTPAEQQAGIDPQQIDADQDALVAAGVAIMATVTAIWAASLTTQVASALGAGIAGLSKLSVDSGAAYAKLTGLADQAVDSGIRQVLAETGQAGGPKLAPDEIPPDRQTLLDAIRSLVDLAAQGFASAVGREATRLAGPNADAEQIAHDAVTTVQANQTPIRDFVTGIVARAMGAGRMAAQQAAMQASGATFVPFSSAIRDVNSCQPCLDNDQHEYPSLAAAAADFPSGHYAACLGRSRCRCVIALRPVTP